MLAHSSRQKDNHKFAERPRLTCSYIQVYSHTPKIEPTQNLQKNNPIYFLSHSAKADIPTTEISPKSPFNSHGIYTGFMHPTKTKTRLIINKKFRIHSPTFGFPQARHYSSSST